MLSRLLPIFLDIMMPDVSRHTEPALLCPVKFMYFLTPQATQLA